MKFEPQHFRTLDHVEHSLGIRNMKRSPLILIKEDGYIGYDNSATGKDELIEKFEEDKDVLLFPWSGQWSTDVFMLSKKDIAKHYLSL